jgi:hypothetical protein
MECSLIGKTFVLHIKFEGSSPSISKTWLAQWLVQQIFNLLTRVQFPHQGVNF